jgi:hypothetical protein
VEEVLPVGFLETVFKKQQRLPVTPSRIEERLAELAVRLAVAD